MLFGFLKQTVWLIVASIIVPVPIAILNALIFYWDKGIVRAYKVETYQSVTMMTSH
jgi:hypothetical protein